MRGAPLPNTVVPLVAVGTLILVLWVAWGSVRNPETWWAPGDLSRHHAGIARCTACHEPFHGPSPARCVGCHAAGSAERRLAGAASWHHELLTQHTTCTTCHTEHHGVSAPIIEPTRTDPHGAVVFRATGAGSCLTCHEFGRRIDDPVILRDEPIVRRLTEKGAHQPGRFADCRLCHGAWSER